MIGRSKYFAGVRNTLCDRIQTGKAYLLFRIDNWRSAVTGLHVVRISSYCVSIYVYYYYYYWWGGTESLGICSSP
jgi:hypothetical protein